MTVEYLVMAAIVGIGLFLLVIFLIPTERKIKKKKKIPKSEPETQQVNWTQKISRLEKHIHSLKAEILKSQKNEKGIEKKLMVERVKVKKFQEKLSQEREWHRKEKGSIDKKGKEYQSLKEELVNVQENFSKAHVTNLRYEHKVKELDQQNKDLNAQRRTVESENSQLKAKVESNRREMAHLKRENLQLQKKKDDVSWVAKTEYERVTKLLKEKEKEIERISRQS